MRHLLTLAVVLALAVTLVAGCGGGSTPSATGKVFPAGAWKATNDVGEVAVMDYRPDGTWVFTAVGEVITSGTYSTDATTITFETDSWCKGEGAEQGTYTWTTQMGQLTLQKQADQCASRIGVLDGQAWTPDE